MSEYDYSVRTSTTQTGNFTCLPETGQIVSRSFSLIEKKRKRNKPIYTIPLSVFVTGQANTTPSQIQQMPAYTTMVFLICCVCHWNNNPATHVQCINCGHVLSTACCTTEKHYVPANR